MFIQDFSGLLKEVPLYVRGTLLEVLNIAFPSLYKACDCHHALLPKQPPKWQETGMLIWLKKFWH